MKMTISLFLKDESGATAIEYSLIAALIALAILAGVIRDQANALALERSEIVFHQHVNAVQRLMRRRL